MRRPLVVKAAELHGQSSMDRLIVITEPPKSDAGKLVGVEVLVQNLKDAFTSASDLYQRLKEYDVEEASVSRKASFYGRDSDSDGRGKGDRRRSRSRGRMEREEGRIAELDENRKLVGNAYRKGYDSFGDKFATGDLLSQAQLQSCIISMQRATISAFQTCCWVNKLRRQEVSHHLTQLLETARAARKDALNALAALSERSSNSNPRSASLLPYPEEEVSQLAIRSRSPSRDRGHKRIPYDLHSPPPYHVFPHKAHSSKTSSVSNDIFCPYARDLQNDPHQPLSDDYKAEGDGCCPYCRCYIPVRPGDLWRFVVTDNRKANSGQRRFDVGNRLVIKSHREGGGYACVLCAQFRKTDTTCAELKKLIDHIRRDHSVEEIESDPDIVEVV